MTNRKDLRKQKFGKWTPQEETFIINSRKRTAWKCICDCGATKVISTDNLISGKTKSCGCSRKCEDLIGKYIGKILVIGLSEKTNKKRVYYLIKCECGDIFNITREALSEKNRCKKCKYKTYKSIDGLIPDWKFKEILASAKIRDIKFEVDREFLKQLFIKQNFKCAISGLDLMFTNVTHRDLCFVSLDRKNSSKGYTEDNLQWVHKDINKMKLNHNQEYFLELCQSIVKYQNSLEKN